MTVFTRAIQFLFRPLTNRIKLGEGGIALFNTSQVWFATHDILFTLWCTLLSLLTLCVLYGYNDYKDRETDKLNPKKDISYVNNISIHHLLFFYIHLFVTALLIMWSFFLLGKTGALSMLLLLAINIAYSNKLKATAGLDVVTVMIWGGLFVLLIAREHFGLAIAASIMTGMAHVFQMLTDKKTDSQTKTNTTVVKYPGSAPFMFAGLSVALMVALYVATEKYSIAISAFIPFLFYFMYRNVTVSWFFSRVYFAGIWFVLLYTTYGGF